MENSLEQQLHAKLAKLHEFYGTLRLSLDELVQRENPVIPPQELQGVLQSVRAHQSTYQAVMDDWNQPGFIPTDRCKQLRIDVANSLAQLLEQLSLLETRAAKAKDRLLPQLDEVVRDRRASAAYQRNSQT